MRLTGPTGRSSAFRFTGDWARTVMEGRSCSKVAERGVVDQVERTIETSQSVRQVGLSGTLDEALVDGGGILTAEDGNAGSFAGPFRGDKDDRGVEVTTGKGSKSNDVVLSGNPMLGVQGLG